METPQGLALPPVIRIEPSASCNLACAHCPTGTVDMSRGIMNEAVFERALGAVKEAGQQLRTVVLYHGGEPLLNKRFPEMVRQVKRLGVPHVKAVSNGMLLLSQKYDEIIDCGIDALEFSLDGRSPDENNFIRRRSDYATVVKNVKGFLDRLLEREAKSPRIYLSNTQFLHSSNPSAWHKDPEPPAHLKREFEKYLDLIEFKCTWAMEWPDMGEEIQESFLRWTDESRAPMRSCASLDETTTIRANGDVVACCYDLTSKFVLGNIMKNSLTEIWRGARYDGLRKSIASGRFVPLCAACNAVRPPVFLLYKPELEERFHRAAAQFL